jgi:hypothetical protein
MGWGLGVPERSEDELHAIHHHKDLQISNVHSWSHEN